MTPLARLIARRIRTEGPMPFATYMREALLHPQHGYYSQKTVFGRSGDFITAPEISQMFGEVLGLVLAERWTALGRPAQFALVELGPGRGTLMADIWRVTRAVPGFHEAAALYLVEAAERRRTEQADKVPHAEWVTDIGDLPPIPALIISNEFFDALPVHQFVWQDHRWHERAVMVANDGETLENALLPPGAAFALKPDILAEPTQGACFEVCPLARQIAADTARHIATYGGAALMIDYGYTRSSFGDTLQAVSNHSFTDLLVHCGEADITAHVDFQALNEAAENQGIVAYGPLEQGTLLMGLGIGARAQALARNSTPDEQTALLGALKRLTAPDQMGQLFKAVLWQNKSLNPPPVFAP